MFLRNRTVSPSHLKDYRLFREEIETSLPIRATFLFLHTACDRRGVFEWDLEALHKNLFPFDTFDNVENSLLVLQKCGAISCYEENGIRCAIINNFHETQLVSGREMPGTLPAPMGDSHAFVPRKTRRNPDDPVPVAADPLPTISPSPASAVAEPVSEIRPALELVSPEPIAPPPVIETKRAPLARFSKFAGQAFRDDASGRTLVANEHDMSEVVVVFPIIGDAVIKEVGVSAGYARMLEEAWTGMDVVGAMRKARMWCLANASRKKTMRGLAGFINTWLTNDAKSGNRNSTGAQVTPIRGTQTRTDQNMDAMQEYLHRNGQGAASPMDGARDITPEVQQATIFQAR